MHIQVLWHILWPHLPVLAAAVLGVASAALAQTAATPTLPPVVVESGRGIDERRRTEEEAREDLRRVPGGTDVVGQEKIEESRAVNLKDALDFVPGVLVQPRFGAADESQISIRGSGLRNNFHLRGVTVLIDGFPYGNADGFGDFESLELATTKRLEVYKGANALRFGGYTLGGAINYVSKTGYDAPLVELRSEAGSFGFLKNYLGTGQVHGPFDLYVGLSDTELDGYRQHGEQLRRRAFATFGYRLPGGTTRAARPRLRAERGEPPGSAHPAGDGSQPAAAQSGQRPLQGRPRLRLRPRCAHGARPPRRRPDARVVHPAQLPGSRSPAVVRDHRRHHLQLRHRAALRAHRAARGDGQPPHRRPPVPRHPPDRRQLRRTWCGNPGRQDQGPAQHRQHGRPGTSRTSST